MYYTNLSDARLVFGELKKASTERIGPDERIDILKSAMKLSRQFDDAGLLALCKQKLSHAYKEIGDMDTAIQTAKEAIGLYQILDNEIMRGRGKYDLAQFYFQSSNYHLSLIYSLEALEIFRVLGNFQYQARVHYQLGTIYEHFDDQKSATLAYEESVDAAREVGDEKLESDAYNPLSGIYLNAGDTEKAEKLIDLSMNLKTQVSDTRGMAFALYGKAKIYVKKGQHDMARSAFEESIRMHRENGELMGLGMCYFKLGELHYHIKDYARAIDALKGALNFANYNQLLHIKMKSDYLLYEIYKIQGDKDKALSYIETYLKDKKNLGNEQTRKIIDSYEAIVSMERMQKDADMQRERAEIMSKRDQAEKASKVKQDFLSTMSHEIRTPLNAVTTITSFLKELATPEQEDLLESLQFSSDNLLRIINDILDFNKLDVGKLTLDAAPSNLRALIRNIHGTYESMAKEKGIAFAISIDQKIEKGYLIDETRLTQILGNLINNAIKFTEEGGVELAIELISTNAINDEIEFRVSDTGIGISEDFIDNVFGTFTQPKSHKTKKHGGSGLGLAIVKKLVEIHGSSIHVESEVGKGSVFYFKLPLKREQLEERKESHSQNGLISKSILLAEDNMINAMVSMKLLSNWGMKCTHAINGHEVVKMARSKAFDCILMDIHMPEMDGFEAAQLIKSEANPNNETPIYALTADIMAKHEQNAGCFDGFLLKPMEQEKLYEVLSQV
ncbi:MAG: ATP-binding protein [Cyclobacteriaceae bacterium]